MKLTVKDRLNISGLYPERSNIVNQILVKDIIKKVQIDQDEMKKIQMKNIEVNGHLQTIWNKDKAKEVNIDFTEAEIGMLKNQVTELDKKNYITQDMIDLVLKIRDFNEGDKDGKK